MAFELNARIKIGSYVFIGVNELTIKKNIHVLVDQATLKIPSLGKVSPIQSLVNKGISLIGLGTTRVTPNLPLSSVQTALLFKEGDPVAIDLGYNGDMRNEFRGFVRRVNLTTPLIIEMEGYAWQLRNQSLLQSWKATTIKEVLEFIIKGTDIVLSPDIPEISLTSFYIKNQSGLEVLECFKSKMLLTAYFADNVLYVGIEEGRTTVDAQGNYNLLGLAEVIYALGYNCISNQDDLKKRIAADNKVKVRLKVVGKNGKHILYEAGDPEGAVNDKVIAFTTDLNVLKRKANAFLKTLKYDGWEGKIKGLLQPYCQPGWKATIRDKRYNGARAGTYFIPGIEVQFGVRGAKRIVDISYNLNPVTTPIN